MKWYETVARYLLGLFYLFGAVDGALYLFFGLYLHGEPQGDFLIALQGTLYFWAFMKSLQFIGAMCLLTNYKPVLGLAILTPISSVLCLFYAFEAPPLLFIFGSIVIICTTILLRAYAQSFRGLFDDYRKVNSFVSPLTAAPNNSLKTNLVGETNDA